MLNTCARALLITIIGLAASIQGSAQTNSQARPSPCVVANSKFNLCPWMYKVPQDRMAQLLKENLTCEMRGPQMVRCQQPVPGKYGQTQVRAQGTNAGRNPGPQGVVYPEETVARMHFAPNLTAEQIWNMSVNYDNQGQLAKAAAGYLKCSEMGHMRCTSALGQMYDQGRGVPQDRIRAVWYLTRAANGGNRGAEYELGVYWEEGEVLPQDLKKALEWYMKSAQLNYPQGQRRIGIAYEFADLTLPRSRPKAIEWLSKSAAQGDGMSAEVLRILRSPNTPAQFRDMDAFSAYYQSLFQQQFAFHAARPGGFNGAAYDHNRAVSAYYSAGDPAGAATCAATPSCRH